MSDPKFKALEDAVSLVAQLANAVIAAPKPLTVGSLSGLLPLLPQIEALAPEFSQILPELEEVDLAESEALLAEIVGAINVGDEKAKEVIAASLKLLVDGIELAKVLKS